MLKNKEDVTLRRKQYVTPGIKRLDKIALSVQSHKLLKQLLRENPKLEKIMRNARNETEALVGVKNWVTESSQSSLAALEYYKGNQ